MIFNTASQEQIEVLKSDMETIAYPYEALKNVLLKGIVSKKQTNDVGNACNIIFIPTPQNQYYRYGVENIRQLIIQGIVVIKNNGAFTNGFNLIRASQTFQGIFLSITTPEDVDISGYICDCMFDFARGN